MQIRNISIRNFRGIRELNWAVPDARLICLIGRGDSTKSTIIESLRRAFFPQWNISFDDADFYCGNPENPINIEVVLGGLTDSFRDLEKYGHMLTGWNEVTQTLAPEPGEGLEDALRIRLIVSDDLEPSWSVIKRDEDDGIPFKASDRAKVAVSLIGAMSDRHLTWSRGSILNQLTESQGITSSLAGAARAAKAALNARRAQDLASFDTVAATAEAASRALGVKVAGTYRSHLDADAINVRMAGLALHDGNIPLRQLGLGSKRMLTIGLQKKTINSKHITLFDEVELGLEPHRIARLLQHLKEDKAGQYFLTTHSPVVLRELTVDDLHVVHYQDGVVNVIAANRPAISDFVQGKIRSGAEAFLAPKIVICEGATEVGFLRGLDEYWTSNKERESFAYRGIAMFDANGAGNISEIAKSIFLLGYDVAVLADSDAPDQFSDEDADELRAKGIEVIKWGGGLSIEERLFADLPWGAVEKSFSLACAISNNTDRILDQIQSQYGQGFDRNFEAWIDGERLRTSLGKAAKISDWFKRQSWGRDWALAVSGYIDGDDIQDSDLVRKLITMRSWVDSV